MADETPQSFIYFFFLIVLVSNTIWVMYHIFITGIVNLTLTPVKYRGEN